MRNEWQLRLYTMESERLRAELERVKKLLYILSIPIESYLGHHHRKMFVSHQIIIYETTKK